MPARLRWTPAHRRTAWLFDQDTCVGSLGFSGYGRASGLTSRGVWHLQRRGVLHQGVHVLPADGRQPPLLLRQPWSLDGELEVPGGEVVAWRTFGAGADCWGFERLGDRVRLLTFAIAGPLQSDITIDVAPSGATLADPTPLLLLGAFLVRLAVDDSVVIAGA
ncbi:hypothetical protein [Luteitalea sp. TBR-22]|uniref:hypothetical protein n=1 Tax=Luteitalea sp. TBR-22 TaxID=2802971 RepID=UPI001EF4FA30|nr:hypothetical protein [Luteitalea sp. TBR-22]